MIFREQDADLLNRIANHPLVLPFFDLGLSGSLDFTACAKDPDAYVILSNGSDAAALFEWSAPSVWEGHTLFAPTCNGARAVATGKAMCAWMFENGANMLWGQTPTTPTIMRRVRWFNRRIGFKSAGIGFHPVSGEVERFVMRRANGSPIGGGGGDFGSR